MRVFSYDIIKMQNNTESLRGCISAMALLLLQKGCDAYDCSKACDLTPRGGQIPTAFCLCNGRGVSRKKTQNQTGYCPKQQKRSVNLCVLISIIQKNQR